MIIVMLCMFKYKMGHKINQPLHKHIIQTGKRSYAIANYEMMKRLSNGPNCSNFQLTP